MCPHLQGRRRNWPVDFEHQINLHVAKRTKVPSMGSQELVCASRHRGIKRKLTASQVRSDNLEAIERLRILKQEKAANYAEARTRFYQQQKAWAEQGDTGL